MPFPENDSELKNYQIIFATSQGKIRKNSLEDFSSINSAGKIYEKQTNIYTNINGYFFVIC